MFLNKNHIHEFVVPTSSEENTCPVQGNSIVDIDLLKYAIQATSVCSNCKFENFGILKVILQPMSVILTN